MVCSGIIVNGEHASAETHSPERQACTSPHCASPPVVYCTFAFLFFTTIICHVHFAKGANSAACRRQRGLKNRANALILIILYLVFLVSTTLWGLELAQLIGLDEILLSPSGLDTDGLFNRFYDLVARETKITGVLFECQVCRSFLSILSY